LNRLGFAALVLAGVGFGHFRRDVGFDGCLRFNALVGAGG
jgi:hypothetical protein